MRLIRQEHENGCGVAVFAMLAEISWKDAVAELGFDGEPIDFRHLRRKLEERGKFVRAVLTASECGGAWPPRPFAPAHMVCVTQPSGSGHYVAMDNIGTVYDPQRPKPRSLREWDVVHEVLGVL